MWNKWGVLTVTMDKMMVIVRVTSGQGIRSDQRVHDDLGMDICVSAGSAEVGMRGGCHLP